jgi:hypothetical protein
MDRDSATSVALRSADDVPCRRDGPGINPTRGIAVRPDVTPPENAFEFHASQHPRDAALE